MPIILRTPVRRLSQGEFGKLAYSVMACVFEIHHELGRFFDEKIYQKELALRYPGVQLEVPIELVHGSFSKFQYIDVLANGGGVFELKTVDLLIPRHCAQLLQYLLLAELGHGKLVNLRKETVEHEFVNTGLTRKTRTNFELDDSRLDRQIDGVTRFMDTVVALLTDWGTGLDLTLYQEAVTHLLGGDANVLVEVGVRTSHHLLGNQRMHLVGPRVAFAITTLPEADLSYESHARRLLKHTELEAILWTNIALKRVTFTSIT
jgi:GxxExxY protein